MKILIAEDYPDNRDVLSLMLNSFGCSVDWVANGQQALDKLAKDNSFDIVLMDCQMPVLDGYEATRQLRQREGEQHHTIVVGVTANALAEDKDKCLSAGMDDYLSKPIMMEKLTELLLFWSRSR
ncbi:MAG: response regulator [Cyanobacteria bacterium P01_G01_bin.49]